MSDFDAIRKELDARIQGTKSPEAPSETTAPAAVATKPAAPAMSHEELRNTLGIVDGLIRGTLGLPQREGFEIEFGDDGDALDAATAMILPWAKEHASVMSSGVRATVGLAVLLGSTAQDVPEETWAEWMGKGEDGEPVQRGGMSEEL